MKNEGNVERILVGSHAIHRCPIVENHVRQSTWEALKYARSLEQSRENAQRIICALASEQWALDINLPLFSPMGARDVVFACLLAHPNLRVGITDHITVAFRNRITPGPRSYSGKNDLAIITALFEATTAVTGSEAEFEHARREALDNGIHGLLQIACAERFFKTSPVTNEDHKQIKSTFSDAFTLYVKKVFEDAETSVEQGPKKRLKKTALEFYKIAIAREGELADGFLEAVLCDEIFYKCFCQYPRSFRMAALSGFIMG